MMNVYIKTCLKPLRELGWLPRRTDFAEGLAATIDWYREKESWWRPVKEATEAKYTARGSRKAAARAKKDDTGIQKMTDYCVC